MVASPEQEETYEETFRINGNAVDEAIRVFSEILDDVDLYSLGSENIEYKVFCGAGGGSSVEVEFKGQSEEYEVVGAYKQVFEQYLDSFVERYKREHGKDTEFLR